MSAWHVFACTLIFNLGTYFLISAEEFCEESVRVKLDGAVEAQENSSITHNSTVFKNGTYWKSGDEYFGCPCLVKHCIRLCDSKTLEYFNLTEPGEDFDMDIWHEEQNQTVKLHDHFYAIPEKNCFGTFLEPENYERDNHTILKNGSLHLLMGNAVLGPDTFCLAANNSKIAVKYCLEPEDSEREDSDWMAYVYSGFMIISIIFLLLTEIAFFVSPEMQNLHGKNIACQSGTLMMGFIGLTVSYLTGADSHYYVCKIFAYLAYFFMLSSFFWLSTMGFDIFWTFSDFKQMTGSVHQTHKKKFKMYAVYSTIIPLIVFLFMVSMDQVLDDTTSLFPGIGENKCWFKDNLTEFLYYHGPVMFLLLANIAFFSVTMFKIYKMKKEGRDLKRSNSKSHNGKNETGEDEQRFLMFIKLFILMGGTWPMEILSWAIGGSEWIWFIPDLINCSRGVPIFVLCVWNNKKVRDSILKRISLQFTSVVESSESSSKTCDILLTANDPTKQNTPEIQETPC